MRNLIDVKNLTSPLPRSKLFKLMTEFIVVRKLTNVRNVASPLTHSQYLEGSKKTCDGYISQNILV